MLFRSSKLLILRGRTMNMILAHTLVFVYMLRAERMVRTKNHPYRKEDYRDGDQGYDEYHFHFCAQKSMQRYGKKLKVES